MSKSLNIGSSPDWIMKLSVSALTLAALLIAMVLLKLPVLGIHVPKPTRSEIAVPASLVLENGKACLPVSDCPTAIVMFGDYECGPCVQEWEYIKAFHRKAPRSFNVYFRHFPLHDIHANAIKYALLAEIAHTRGSFPFIHEELYRSRLLSAPLDAKLVASYLEGGTPEEVRAAQISVSRDRKDGQALGVSGTPAVFLVEQSSKVFLVSDIRSELSRITGQSLD